MEMRTVEFSIEEGDIRAVDADLIALKYAQGYHGADKAVAQALARQKIEAPRPADQEREFVQTQGAIAARQALFVGVPHIVKFGYREIRQLMQHTLDTVVGELPTIKHLAMTIHGVDTFVGLDEEEAFLAQFTVCLTAAQLGTLPRLLSRITIVEVDSRRVQHLRHILEKYLAYDRDIVHVKAPWGYHVPVGIAANRKRPRVFVAMPFHEDFSDLYYFAIQRPILAAGFWCERIDQEIVPGDIFRRIKQGISKAELVVAVVTTGNPNVALEVGYALGKGKEKGLILLNRAGEKLPFDIQGVNCLFYQGVKDLRTSLAKAINQHVARNGIRMD